MRILHTADWHLGKRLYDIERIDEQQAVLNEIIEVCERENVDIVLIAGDIYDIPTPSIRATQLFFQTIMKLSNNAKRIVIAIAGNHDAAEGIAAPNELAKTNGIILIGHPNIDIGTYTFNDRFQITDADNGYIEITIDNKEKLRLLTTPYANELRLRKYLGEDEDKGINEFLASHWLSLASRYMQTSDSFNILISHLYMWSNTTTPPEEPDGEKPIRIGNASLILTQNIPKEIHYTALGHLHRSQQADTEGKVFYSGSPLAYSFSEAGQEKYVHILDIDEQNNFTLKKIALNSGIQLLRNKVNNYLEAAAFVTDHSDAHIELTISTDDYLNANEVAHLQKLSKNILNIIPDLKREDSSENTIESFSLDQGDIKQHFISYFKEKKGQNPNEDLLTLFQSLIAMDEESLDI